ncbi:hypothetical protein L873DRAFT_1792216 [Choiromyces venosus 120613-1]|uniref:Uncharacterized protein n=1 Tax=Choiromyces venosus 120613-1 TaxID=1336337 RepID=A0A3N4JEB5_9PEZI|nr:hypothetical protein L873DRAFT_1792216 [Choiromyces venosus 120613-1]
MKEPIEIYHDPGSPLNYENWMAGKVRKWCVIEWVTKETVVEEVHTEHHHAEPSHFSSHEHEREGHHHHAEQFQIEHQQQQHQRQQHLQGHHVHLAHEDDEDEHVVTETIRETHRHELVPHRSHTHIEEHHHHSEHPQALQVYVKEKVYKDDDSSSSSSSSSSDSSRGHGHSHKQHKHHLLGLGHSSHTGHNTHHLGHLSHHGHDHHSHHSHSPSALLHRVKEHLPSHHHSHSHHTPSHHTPSVYVPSVHGHSHSNHHEQKVHHTSTSELEFDNASTSSHSNSHTHSVPVVETTVERIETITPSYTPVVSKSIYVEPSPSLSSESTSSVHKEIHIPKPANSLKSLKMVKYDAYASSGHDDIHIAGSVSHHKPHHDLHTSSSSHISSAHAQSKSTFTIPCHHIRIGDLVILQHRPCQIIRITTSAQTGQHRYLGVDLFTKQLHEEPCVVSHPSPSVVLHSLLGPVFKQYRLIDIRDDGKLVAMTETGEIKQGLKVVDQGHLWGKLKEAFGHGSGSVRVLVISDHGKELAVDYKIVHLAHKL